MEKYAGTARRTPLQERSAPESGGFVRATSGWSVLLLATLVVLTFGRALAGEFVDDDLDLVAHSPAFGGLGALWDAVRMPFWGEDYPYWRPLTSALMCVGHALGGTKPWMIHALALLAHLGSAVAVLRLACVLGADGRWAVAIATLFVLHPAHVESVAWVAALADPWFGCCGLWAAVVWLQRRDGAHAPWPALVLLALAMAAKETGLVIPPLLVLVDLATRDVRADPRGYARAWTAIVAVAGGYVALRMIVFDSLAAGFDRGAEPEVAGGLAPWATQAYLAGRFAEALVWPFPPELFRVVPAHAVRDASAWLEPLAALGVLALLFARCRSHDRTAASVGAILLVVPLMPALLHRMQVGPWPVVDRYLYLSIAGASIIGGFALRTLATRTHRGRGRNRRLLRRRYATTGEVSTALLLGPLRPENRRVPRRFSGLRTRWTIVLAVGAAFAITSWRAVPWWRDPAAVASRAAREAPGHPETCYLVARRLLAEAAGLQGQAAAERYRDARRWFRAALAGLADGQLYAGAWMRRVLRPSAELGAAYAALFGRLRSIEELRERFRSIARRWPESADAAVGLGVCLAESGDLRGAAAAFDRALSIDENHAAAASNAAALETFVQHPQRR